MIRAIQCRLYPTKEQQAFLRGQFGAVRFVYNKALAIKTHCYRVHGVNLSPIHDLKKLLPVAKKSRKYSWLAQYDSTALQESLRHLDKAFSGFFKKLTGFPQFKSRRGEQSSYHCSCLSVGEHWIKVPKMSRIKAVIHRPIEGKVKSITLRLDRCGDYWASILYDDGNPEPEPLKAVSESKTLACDIGLKTFAVCSDSTAVESPRAYKRAQKKLKKAQRALSRKKKGSRNREKARRRFAKICRRVARIRADFLHKTSRKLVNESQALIFESLHIKNMMKNHHLAGAIADAGWGEFLRQCQYKAEREGKRFVQIDRFFPSSRLCSHCGYKFSDLTLAVREWTCPQCGAHHDRDFNACLNIKQEGIRKMRAEGLAVLRG